MTCCFFGHRDVPADIVQRLTPVVEGLIQEGVTEFLMGNQGGFDSAALRVMRDLKIVYPEIDYWVVLAYNPAERNPGDYRDLETLYPEEIDGTHPRYAIEKRNNYLLQESDVVVTYITHTWGGAYKYVDKANRQGKRIIKMGELTKKSMAIPLTSMS